MNRLPIALLLVPTMLLLGCGETSGPPAVSAGGSQRAVGDNGSDEAPAIGAAAVGFFQAVARGDRARAINWLTPPAISRLQREPGLLAPLDSGLASVELGEVRQLDEDEAAVQLLLRENAESTPVEIGCLLKLTDGGWRVCGVASDEQQSGSPVVISFEPISSPADDTVVEQRSGSTVPRTASDSGRGQPLR